MPPQAGWSSAIVLLGLLSGVRSDLPGARPPYESRTFHSTAVDNYIENTAQLIADPDLATLFSNCLPNTLDTTVFHADGRNDTFIITGDIPAMWLRDSTNQVGLGRFPYAQCIVPCYFSLTLTRDNCFRRSCHTCDSQQRTSPLQTCSAGSCGGRPEVSFSIPTVRPGMSGRPWQLVSRPNELLACFRL